MLGELRRSIEDPPQQVIVAGVDGRPFLSSTGLILRGLGATALATLARVKGEAVSQTEALGDNTARKPTPPARYFGSPRRRLAERQHCGSPPHEPPRTTRPDPEDGPGGSDTTLSGYCPYQSPHHSHTFPCIS
jgi:hypothetical protein